MCFFRRLNKDDMTSNPYVSDMYCAVGLTQFPFSTQTDIFNIFWPLKAHGSNYIFNESLTFYC